jgi:hypothetical protein
MSRATVVDGLSFESPFRFRNWLEHYISAIAALTAPSG